MKRFLLLFLLLTALKGFSRTIIITNWGAHFTPADTTAEIGDTIKFNLGNTHNVLEVDQQTWEAEEQTPLAGGFSLPMGGGILLTANLPKGTHYYICTPHISLGMKAIIRLTGPAGINDQPVFHTVSLFPVPANNGISVKTSARLIGSPYVVTDETGRQVAYGKLESAEMYLNIDHLSSGIYFFLAGTKREERLLFIKQ